MRWERRTVRYSPENLNSYLTEKRKIEDYF
jgi:hypothetical protein